MVFGQQHKLGGDYTGEGARPRFGTHLCPGVKYCQSPAGVATNDVVFDILLTEDNLVNQKLAVKILEKYGHSVEIAENGLLMVDAFTVRVQQNRPFDIILVCVRTHLP